METVKYMSDDLKNVINAELEANNAGKVSLNIIAYSEDGTKAAAIYDTQNDTWFT